MNRGLFVTGTDTGIGKTLISCMIARLLRKQLSLAVMKPYASGSRQDAKRLRQSAGLGEKDLKWINPVFYREPLAPYSAAGFENDQAGWSKVFSAYQYLSEKYDFLLVEGIGGLHVPLTRSRSVADLVRKMDLPLLIVARAGLGTLNHTLLTVDYALKKKLKILGIVMSEQEPKLDISFRTNQEALSHLVSVPVWGSIPFLRGRFEEKVEMGIQLRFLKDRLRGILK